MNKALFANHTVTGVLKSRVIRGEKSLIGQVVLSDAMAFLCDVGNQNRCVFEYVGPAEINGKLCNVRVDASYQFNNDVLTLQSSGAPVML